MRFKLIPVVFIISFWCCLQAQAGTNHSRPDQYKETLVHNGVHRSYILHIPPQYDSKKKLPLVLLFHGGGGNARQALASYGMAKTADKEGFILVAPNGSGRFKNRFLTWNVTFGFGYAKRNNTDDIGFVTKLISKLQSELRIDPKRIFATGISNGGFLCHFLAAHLSGKIAAIAPIAASIGGKESSEADFILPPVPKHPVSVIAFNGLMDKHIPYSGGIQKKHATRKPIYVTSAQEMHRFWIKANRCDSKSKVEENKTRQYRKITYSKGDDNTEVIQYLIFNLGHAWPGGKKPRPRADTPSNNVKATDLMWEFFKKHPKKDIFNKSRELNTHWLYQGKT